MGVNSMGKLIICSQKENLIKMKRIIQGFSENGNVEGTFGYLTTYSKLRVATENICQGENSFAAGTGTFIYKSKTGKDALFDILSDFNDVNNMQNNIYGSFCIIVYKNSCLNIFTDASSTYNIYYYLSGGNIILSNTYYHVACCLDEVINNGIGLTENWLRSAIDGTTPIKYIYKLMGNQVIKYRDHKWCISKVYNKSNTKNVANLASFALKMYRCLPKVFESCGVFLTGGQDSRLSLALLLAIDMPTTLYYGIGDSSDTATQQEDLNIVEQIAKTFSLPINKMNWKNSDQINIDQYLKKYGELFMCYNMNKNVMREFEEKIKTELVAFGYFGEVYRTIEAIEEYKKDNFTLDEFVDELYLKTSAELFNEGAYKEYRTIIKKQYEEICGIKEIDPNHLTKNDFQKLNTVYRQRWDTQMNNFANQFFYSLPLFGNKMLTDQAEQVTYNDRLNSKFLMKCIGDLEPMLLQVPFFSHIKAKTFNPITYELTDKEVTAKVKDKIRTIVHNEKLMKTLRLLYYTIRGDYKGRKEIIEQYSEKIFLSTVIKANTYVDLIDVNNIPVIADARSMKRLILLDYLIKSLTSKQN